MNFIWTQIDKLSEYLCFNWDHIVVKVKWRKTLCFWQQQYLCPVFWLVPKRVQPRLLEKMQYIVKLLLCLGIVLGSPFPGKFSSFPSNEKLSSFQNYLCNKSSETKKIVLAIRIFFVKMFTSQIIESIYQYLLIEFPTKFPNRLYFLVKDIASKCVVCWSLIYIL